MCLAAVKHLQRVLALAVLSGVQDLHPDLVHGAAGLCTDILLHLSVPAGGRIEFGICLPLILNRNNVKHH